MNAKTFMLITFGFLLFGCNINKNESISTSESDLQKLNLNGKVKSVKEEYRGRSWRWSLSLEYEFNDRGYLTKEYNNEAGTSEINIKTYKYNSNGQLIEVNQLTDSAFVKKFILKYSKKGILKEKLVYDGNNEYVGKWKLKYDKNWHLIEKQFLNTEDKLDENYLYSIVSEGKILEETYMKGDFYEKTNFKYDSLGYIIEQNTYSKDGSNLERRTIMYDSLGNEIASLHSYPEGNTFTGDVFESLEYLKYDKFGNWVLKNYSITYMRLGTGAEAIYRREIEYYE